MDAGPDAAAPPSSPAASRRRREPGLLADEAADVRDALERARISGAGMPPTDAEGNLRGTALKAVAQSFARTRQGDLLMPAATAMEILRGVAAARRLRLARAADARRLRRERPRA